ncbi:hypothetical protein, partial [Morganella morganii]|uniref:hypothetical protein n=1 Tax=Morganella morganii TaxID=582 RepID=UPI003BA10E7D
EAGIHPVLIVAVTAAVPAVVPEAADRPVAEAAAVVVAVLPGAGKRHKKAVTKNATAFFLPEWRLLAAFCCHFSQCRFFLCG